VKFH